MATTSNSAQGGGEDKGKEGASLKGSAFFCGDKKDKLDILEIRKDPELIRLHKILYEAEENYDRRIRQLYEENDIKPISFKVGIGFSDNSTSPP